MTEQAPPPPSSPDPIDYSSDGKSGLFSAPPYTGPEPDKDAKTMGMLCHLLAVVAPTLGPLLVWLIKKDQHPFIDDQGKQALNFQLTLLVLWVISSPLLCIFIGVILMGIVAIAHLVFSIIGALKANQGIAYRYPFAAQFIK